MSSTQMATRVRAQGSPTPRLAPLVQVAICKQTIATASARRFHLPPTSAVRQEASTDVAAVAVETIATAALRMRLRTHDLVRVSVQCNSWDLLGGRIQGARVEGRGWESPQGLTARVLDVEVGRVELDLPAVLSQQRILLRNVPTGSARVVFTAADFGAFLQHPLVTTAARKAVQGQPFLFDRQGVLLAPDTGPGGGRVLFSGTLPASGRRYALAMRPVRGGRGAEVQAKAVEAGSENAALRPAGAHVDAAGEGGVGEGGPGSEDEALVSAELSRFFSGLTVDLQGAELAFDAMSLTWGQAAGGGANGRAASRGADAGTCLLELGLRATIRSFPPLNIQF